MSRSDYIRPPGPSTLRTARAILEQLGRLDASVTLNGDCWLRWTTLIARTFLRDPTVAAAALDQLRAAAKLSEQQARHEQSAKAVTAKVLPIEKEIEELVAEPQPAARRAKASRKRARSTRSAVKRVASNKGKVRR